MRFVSVLKRFWVHLVVILWALALQPQPGHGAQRVRDAAAAVVQVSRAVQP
ncbi:MAG TPA: hypothetical protein VIV40_05760 [Kofleriaceae bacterium]